MRHLGIFGNAPDAAADAPPRPAAILSNVDLTVIGPDPKDALLYWARRNGNDSRKIFGAGRVEYHAAAVILPLPRRIIRRHIVADDFKTPAAVGRFMHELTAEI